MLCFALLFLLVLLCIFVLFYRISKFPKHLLLDGFNLSLIFFGFYFILRPFDYLVIGNFLKVEPIYLGSGIDVGHYLVKSLACSVFAFCCFLAGSLSCTPKTFVKSANKVLNVFAHGIEKNHIVLSVSLIFLSSCVAFLWGSRLFTNVFLLLTGLILIAVRSKKNRLMWYVVFLVVFVCGFYYYTFIRGERRDLFKFIYIVVILKVAFDSADGVRVVPGFLKKAGVYSLLLVGLIYLALVCRFYSVFHEEKDLKQILLLDHLYTSHNPHDNIVLNLDFAVVYDDYMFLLNNVPDENPYIYGKTYSKFLFGFIPRSLWPEKPETVNILYFKTFFPEQYTAGRSRAVSMIGEMYWNFSYMGVMCGMCIMGFFIRILDNILYSSIENKEYVKIMFICLMFSYILDIFRGGLFTNFAQMFICIFLIPFMITILTFTAGKIIKLSSKT